MIDGSTLYNTNINVGSPPLLWSTVDDAFRQINANFEIIAATLGTSGITPLNFNDLDSSVKPADSNVYQLGDADRRWKNLYVSEFLDVPTDELNGVWLGTAQIKGIGGTIELPANSTVNGDLIIDPDKTFFKTIKITGDRGGDIVASRFNDDLKLNSGTGVEVSVDSSAESIVIDNTGIITASAGTGISVSGTDPLLITNTGVISIGPVAALPSGLAAGTGIAVNTSSGTPTITNTGIVGLTAGYGITITPDLSTGVSDISFNVAVAPQAAFVTIQVPGQIPLLANSTADILIIEGSGGIEVVTSEPPGGNATITFNFNNRIDIIGSVFSDDSTMMVDATNGTFIGDLKGSVVSDDSTILVDAVDGKVLCDVINSSVQTDSLVVNSSGFINFNGSNVLNGGTVEAVLLLALNIGVTGDIEVQGELTGNVKGNVVGDLTGSVFSDGSTMLVDGTGGKIVGPVETTTVTTDTLFSGTIDTVDSSEIQIIPSLNVNSDLTVGGDILPSANLGGDLGSPTQRWKDLYLSGNTINLGGAVISNDPATGSVNLTGAIVARGVIGFRDTNGNFRTIKESGLADDPSEIFSLPTPLGPFPNGVIITDLGAPLTDDILLAFEPLDSDTVFDQNLAYIQSIYTPVLDESNMLTGFRMFVRGVGFTQDGNYLADPYPQGPMVAYDQAAAFSIPETLLEFRQWAATYAVKLGVENVVGEYSIPGSRSIDLFELQNIVAASSDFDDFKARIAALT